MMENDDSFHHQLLFSDEAVFYLSGHVNRHNCEFSRRASTADRKRSAEISPETRIRALLDFPWRLRACLENDGGHIEGM